MNIFNFSLKNISFNQIGVVGFMFICTLILLFTPDVAHATGGGMPYEDGLKKIQDSLTGPWALGVSIVAIIGGVAGFVVGGADLTQFAKTMLGIVIGVAVIVNAASLATYIGAKGAMISPTNVVSHQYIDQNKQNDLYTLNTHLIFTNLKLV